jgi:alpha-L-arabinofuranosidase
MEKIIGMFLGFVAFAVALRGAEYSVAITGSDSNPGSQAAPFRTIQHAADIAQPGDLITVHQGVYRERVNPVCGGLSDAERIVYEAAPEEKVVITGSEAVTNWEKVKEDIWEAVLPNSFFGDFNPYTNVIHGDWFNPLGHTHHAGAVYLNGDWLTEATEPGDLLKPAGKRALWFATVDGQNTTIRAQFKGINPNEQHVEINARETVFYPKKTGINYITVRGFTLENAATPWAPPTAEQIGLIGTHWSKGWIIESNIVRYSLCSGISLGKYGDAWDNSSSNSAGGYVLTIDRALTNGWSKKNIGNHLVRGNTISHCEQTGIVGSLGAAFSTISGNTIYDIHKMNWFSGAEIAGIKFHGAIDVQIEGNHIYKTSRGLWLDWMAQGTRVSANLFNDNGEDVFVEVDHGPFLFDNNLLLSPGSLTSRSQGGAYVHNLFAGAIHLLSYDSRQTPFLKPHATTIAGFHDNPLGDDRYYNNLFVKRVHLTNYDTVKLSSQMSGNVFLDGAIPSVHEKNPVVEPDFDPQIEIIQKDDGFYLQINFKQSWIGDRHRKLVTSSLLGKATIPDLPYVQPDNESIRIDAHYFGKKRDGKNPSPGPFEKPGNGQQLLKVW